MEWVNGKERLPDYGSNVLVWQDSICNRYCIAHYNRGGWGYHTEGWWIDEGVEFFWMPLPEAPK